MNTRDSLSSMFYTGIGSRALNCDAALMSRLVKVASRLRAHGLIARSGDAIGPDRAIARGAGQACISFIVPHGAYGFDPRLYPSEQWSKAERISASLHPAWTALSVDQRRPLIRNAFQVLGSKLDTPSSFVLCATADGVESGKATTRSTGGTGHTIRIASEFGVPVFNITNPDALARLALHLESRKSAIAKRVKTPRVFHEDRTRPAPDEGWIWCYGSNLAARNGKGAALVAKNLFGATKHVCNGRNGNSYAIPTKDERLKVLEYFKIAHAIEEFVQYSKQNLDLRFFVTRIGCELAGFNDAEIAPLFRECAANCSFPMEWEEYL